MTDKEDLIHRLQEEIIFLQTTEIENLEHYKYTLEGNLAESRSL